MRPLLQNRLAAWCGGLLLFVASERTGAAEAADIVSDVSKAIASTIRWQQHWFGASFGADCIAKRAEHGADLIVFLPRDERATLAAYVEGSNVLYAGRSWPGKISVEPSAGSPGACRPGEIAEQVKFDRKPGTVTRGPFALTAAIDTEQVAAPDSKKIAAMVMRSLAAYYATRNRQMPKNVRLAEYRPSDPLLIVTSKDGDELNLLDFPPLAAIDEQTIVAVYSGDIFLGPDVTPQALERVRQHALSEVSRRSIAIGSP